MAGLLLLMVAGGAYHAARPARAAVDPAACATPDDIESGGGVRTIRVAAGEVVLLTGGTFTGPIDLLESGGTLCVAADANLNPNAVRQPAGGLVVQGTARFPSFTSRSGFALFVAGTVVINKTILLGSSSVEVVAGASLTGGQLLLLSGSLTTNAGTLDSGIETSNGATVVNSGDLTARGGFELEGPLFNTGRIISLDGPVEFTFGSTVTNSCMITAPDDDVIVTSSSTIINHGLIQAPTGTLRVYGKYTQTPTGVTASAALHNEGAVFGFGRYHFSGFTRTFGVFAGASAAEPVVVDELTPPAPPAIFDLQSGTVANVVTGSVAVLTANSLPGDCVPSGDPVADVTVAKVGPAVIAAGTRITYTLIIANNGPDSASSLVITDFLPAALTALEAPDGTLEPGPTARWTLTELPAGSSRTFTVSGTVPDTGTLLNRATATASTADPNPGNNDGSTEVQQLSTEIQPGTPVNQPPVVEDNTFDTISAFPTAGSVAFADPDTQQNHLVALNQAPRNGFVTLNPSGVFYYTPRFGFTGSDDFTVVVCDNGSPVLCDEGTLTIVVAPLAVPDTAYSVIDAPVRIDVLHNDIGETTAPSVLSPPTQGTAVVDGTEIVYTPPAGFIGVAEFDYKTCASSDTSICGTATVTVFVDAPPDEPPVADDVAVTTVVNTMVTATVPVYEPEVGEPVNVVLHTPPVHGVADVFPNGSFSYTPNTGFAGVDSFTVEACEADRTAFCDDATVTVTVNPVVRADTAQTDVDVAVSIPVTANDLGTIGAPRIVTDPGSGTAVVQPNQTVTYTPNPGFTGLDLFEYEVCAATAATVCVHGPVAVTVGAQPNRPPVVQTLELETVTDRPVSEHLMYYDPDVGQVLTVTIAPGPSHGTATINPEGIVTYTPAANFAGTDVFRVTVCDDDSTPACTSVDVPVTVRPLVMPDGATVDVGGWVDIPVGANDRGDVGPVTITVPPAHAVAEVAAGFVRYTPDPNFAGRDSFTYRVCATSAPTVCDTAEVRVAVLLVAVEDGAATNSGRSVDKNVLANDLVGPDTAVTIRTAPTNGTVAIASAGTVTYSPAGPFAGVDSFNYSACTAANPPICAHAPVTVLVVPLVKSDVTGTRGPEPVVISVEDNDFGEATPPEVTTPPANGTVTGGGVLRIDARDAANLSELGAAAPLVYTPHAGFAGTDAFTYRRCAISNPNVCGFGDVIVVVAPPQLGEQPPTSTPPPAGGTTPPAALAPTTGNGGSLAATGVGLAILGAAGLALLVGAGLRLLARRRGEADQGPAD
ncbi:MAG TPA: Ig-like domain-containing protein [Actinophytocola sp.]|uniref:Ig-like domain-containing protein n=1 Tax=Actinophytocola sp. TaxID=1872138 RepID=UPI002DBE522A|nr:Ig-like domain-containing protein [Actinophytocola sp.]HEU5472369.1 Ig-like domain-containing protein [Actinophytocola sp.]